MLLIKECNRETHLNQIDFNDPKQNPKHVDNFKAPFVSVDPEDWWSGKDPYRVIRTPCGAICPFVPMWVSSPLSLKTKE